MRMQLSSPLVGVHSKARQLLLHERNLIAGGSGELPGNAMARFLTLRASMPIVRVGNEADNRSIWVWASAIDPNEKFADPWDEAKKAL